MIAGMLDTPRGAFTSPARGPDQIDEGDLVEFDIGADREGRQQAKNACVLDRPTTDCADIRLGDIGADGTI
jgi:hypothetical protein